MPETKSESETKALKPLRSFTPVGVILTTIEVGLFYELVRLSTGALRVGTIAFLALTVAGFLAAPRLKRKMWRQWMVGARSIERIKAMKTKQPNVDDVFDAAPMTDRSSFFTGYAFAMRQVETQIERAGEDVDAL